MHWQCVELLEIAARLSSHQFEGTFVHLSKDMTSVNYESWSKCNRLRKMIIEKSIAAGQHKFVRIVDYNKLQIDDSPATLFDDILSTYALTVDEKNRIINKSVKNSIVTLSNRNQSRVGCECMFLYRLNERLYF